TRLQVKEENRCTCDQNRQPLCRQNHQGALGSALQPPDCEEDDYGQLPHDEKLKQMRCNPLVWRACGADENETTENNRQGSQRHHHGCQRTWPCKSVGVHMTLLAR